MNRFDSMTPDQKIQEFNEFMKDPVNYGKKMGFDIPTNLNTADGILNYIIQSKGINQDQCNQVMMASRGFQQFLQQMSQGRR